MVTLRSIEIVLNDTRQLLSNSGESFWCSKIEALLSKSEPEQLRGVLVWFGGMGSLSDMVISRFNGHTVDKKDERRANKNLDKLREELFELASSAAKELKSRS